MTRPVPLVDRKTMREPQTRGINNEEGKREMLFIRLVYHGAYSDRFDSIQSLPYHDERHGHGEHHHLPMLDDFDPVLAVHDLEDTLGCLGNDIHGQFYASTFLFKEDGYSCTNEPKEPVVVLAVPQGPSSLQKIAMCASLCLISCHKDPKEDGRAQCVE